MSDIIKSVNEDMQALRDCGAMSEGVSKLELCPFCKSKQLEVVKIDMKDPDRDLIKCRHCRGQVMRFHWNQRHITIEQARKVVEDAGMVCVPIGHLQCVQNQLSSAKECIGGAEGWVDDFVGKYEAAQKD